MGKKVTIIENKHFDYKTQVSDSVSFQDSNDVICFLCTMSINGPKSDLIL